MTSERDEISGTGFNLGQPAPGVIVGNGRYRLVAYHGDRPQLQFWQGIDLASGQEVALTLVDAEGALPEELVHEILASTVRLKGLDMPGIARVQEVLHTGRFGVKEIVQDDSVQDGFAPDLHCSGQGTGHGPAMSGSASVLDHR